MTDKTAPEQPTKTPSSIDQTQQVDKPVRPGTDTVRAKAITSSAVQSESERLQAAAAAHVNQRDQSGTEKFSQDMLGRVPQVGSLPFGLEMGAASFYRKLPLSLASADIPDDVPRWRVDVEGIAPGIEPVGLDILGDSVIGRGRVGDQSADVDLDQYGGLEKGVSRRHALLRPTANHLYIIDLGSTNGTMHNGLPLGPGIARSLKHNDTLTFGKLSVTIKIVDGPGMHKKEQPPAKEDEAEPTRRLDDKPVPGAATSEFLDPTGAVPMKPSSDSGPLSANKDSTEKSGKK